MDSVHDVSAAASTEHSESTAGHERSAGLSGLARDSIDDETLNAPEVFSKDERATAVVRDSEPKGASDEFPDGGLRAWLVVFGGFCTCFGIFGIINSWGVFQSYYEETLLQSSSASDIAWIGSIQYSFCFFPSIIIGRLFDLGHFKVPFFLASCAAIVATFLIGQCTEYWQLLLCQGFAMGLAAGVAFGPLWGLISHWFKTRRGTAMGIFACGTTVGGTVYPIAFRSLIGKIGFPWTMRVFGLTVMLTMIIGNLTLHRRLPPVDVAGGFLNLRIFKSLPFTLFAISAFVAYLGLYTVQTYIVISASANGVDERFAFYLLSITNASSVVGRVSAGLLTDTFGAINVMAPNMLAVGVVTYIWTFVHGKAGYVAIAVLYGLCSGAYVSLIGAPMIALGDTGDVGRRTGLYVTVLAAGALIGPPISGAINERTDGYSAVGFYAGTMVIVSVCVMWAAKCLILGRFWGKF